MFRKLQALAALVCMFSYSAAETVSIGTASARGEMRIDSYMVKGNATLFDGTVVETGQATADLRLDKGTEITMSTSSRGTLYRNRLVLQRGESELASNSSFQLEANGLRVTPNETNSRGVVSLRAGNTVEVAALNGSFGVTNDHGVLLASVRPGHALSFAIQAGAAPTSNLFSGEGVISFENGHYYFESLEGKYELTGKDFKRYVGTKVHISGTVQGSDIKGTLLSVAVLPIAVSSIGVIGGAGISATTGLIIAGTVVAAGAGVGVGISVANQSATPASR
jgi:hypothetical protein